MSLHDRTFFIRIDCALCRKPTSATWPRILQLGWPKTKKRTTLIMTVMGTQSLLPPRKSYCPFPPSTTLRWGEKNEVSWSPPSIQVLIFVVSIVSVDRLPALWEKLLQRARGAQQLERNSSDWVKTEVELEGEKSCNDNIQVLYMIVFEEFFLYSFPCFRYLVLLLQSLPQVLPILALMNSLCTKSASLSTLSPHPFSVRYSVSPSNMGQHKEMKPVYFEMWLLWLINLSGCSHCSVWAWYDRNSQDRQW